jgi:DNA-directed RNA polymerase subunit beta'
MLQKIRVIDSGDTRFLDGDQAHKGDFFAENLAMANKIVIEEAGDSLFRNGQLSDKKTVDAINKDLKKSKKKVVKYRAAQPASFNPLLLGITQAALTTKSFISAASFQETTQVLTDAATAGKEDGLIGLKENVIMGHLIPAGTGLTRYDDMRMEIEQEEVVEEEISEQNQIEETEKSEEL